MAFDLKNNNYSVAAALGYTFNLELPTGEVSDATLTVIGDLSKEVRDYSKRKYQEYQNKINIAKKRGKEVEDITLEEAEEMAVESALVRLTDWSGFTEGGKKVEFSKEKAKEILKEHSWIRDQIMLKSSDVVNFRPKDAK